MNIFTSWCITVIRKVVNKIKHMVDRNKDLTVEMLVQTRFKKKTKTNTNIFNIFNELFI